MSQEKMDAILRNNPGIVKNLGNAMSQGKGNGPAPANRKPDMPPGNLQRAKADNVLRANTPSAPSGPAKGGPGRGR